MGSTGTGEGTLGAPARGGVGSALMASTFQAMRAMGPVIYLALVGAGLVAAAAISFVLRGIKLI